jgi:hypothetical protein
MNEKIKRAKAKEINPKIGHYTSLITNLFQGRLLWIQKWVGKRPLFLFPISVLTLANLGLVVAMPYKSL